MNPSVSAMITDPADHLKARLALKDLWDAMHLTEWSPFWNAEWEARIEAYRTFAKAIMGDDYPEWEIWC